jgi:cobalamin biosynthesis Mg chelatase CobN
MRIRTTAIAIATFCVALSLPAVAVAGPYLPPGNSAATQYTETFPSSGGNVEVNGPLAAGGGSPEKALGKKTADALAAHGAEGEQVAQLAAEAAPQGGGAAADGKSGDQEAGGGAKSHHRGSNSGGGAGGPGSGGSTGPGGGSAGSGGGGSAASASGGSAAGQVVSYATLSSSGSMGIFLPLVLLAALAWAIFYLWRRRGEGSEPAGT